MDDGHRLGRGLGWAVEEPLRLERDVVWLIVFSLLDFFLTYALLGRDGAFYESNPLADWFLRRYNVAGLVSYKLVLIGGVISICETVERCRPGTGRRVVRFGTAAAAAVVGYSLFLAWQFG